MNIFYFIFITLQIKKQDKMILIKHYGNTKIKNYVH